jgi:uncharacterized protein (TIGR03435 family)
MAQKPASPLAGRHTPRLLLAGLVLTGALVSVGAFTGIAAQAPAGAASHTFDVASVKPNTSGPNGPVASGTQPGGRLTMINVPLRMVIRTAYQVQDYQLVDAPDWIAAERFDINAKAAQDIPPPTAADAGPLRAMIQALLAERFKLAVHLDTRQLPVFALEQARRDGQLGPQLHRSTIDCVAVAEARQSGAAPPPAPGERPRCGVRAGNGQLIAGGFALSQFVTILAPMVQRTVLDRTGLTGNYDIDLRWNPQLTLDAAPGAAPPDTDSPSLFTALQEQLGLRLVATRGPVSVLVIDHVERPTPD